MRFLLDTNILLHYLRKSKTAQETDALYAPLAAGNEPFVSVVSVGELESIALQNKWGEKKLKQLEELLGEVLVTDIYVRKIILAYAEIDAYSQNKLAGKPLPMTSRNMGKNDLWIAATANVLGAKLLTTDHDFDHLDKILLDVGKL
ncbi:MAG TPA: PIN domain-containing protein [Saprospiraceae bacterium]|nr:PIN domain-containing protein [Saprospiraceae bacterium]